MASSRTQTDSDADGQAGALGGARPVEPGSFRERMRRRTHTRLAWRLGIFVAGLLCILAGFALVVLPGPLTIPPIILGLWIWATEFEWAHRFFKAWHHKGKDAWEHARRHPVSSSVITVGGLVGAGVAIWAVIHFELVARGKELVGLS